MSEIAVCERLLTPGPASLPTGQRQRRLGRIVLPVFSGQAADTTHVPGDKLTLFRIRCTILRLASIAARVLGGIAISKIFTGNVFHSFSKSPLLAKKRFIL